MQHQICRVKANGYQVRLSLQKCFPGGVKITRKLCFIRIYPSFFKLITWQRISSWKKNRHLKPKIQKIQLDGDRWLIVRRTMRCTCVQTTTLQKGTALNKGVIGETKDEQDEMTRRANAKKRYAWEGEKRTRTTTARHAQQHNNRASVVILLLLLLLASAKQGENSGIVIPPSHLACSTETFLHPIRETDHF